MRAWIVLLASFALASCAALHGDGYYSCARSGHCPSSAPVCGADGLCHVDGVDAGAPMDAANDATSSDTGQPALTYPDCDGALTGSCGADVCYYDAVLGSTNNGYCTRHCTADADCPSFDGAPSHCLAGQCARGCTGSADCPDGLSCAAGRWVDGTALRLCVSLVAAEADWYNTCSLDGDCERPLSCVNGYCLRACATTGDCVQFLETCATSAAGARACLYQCDTTAADCATLDAQCVGGGCHPATSW